MGEVDGALTWVSVQASDRSLVSLIEVQHTRPTAVPARRVHCALLGPNQEVVDIILWEAEAGGGHRLALLVLQFQGLLWLSKHVQAPAAHLSIR